MSRNKLCQDHRSCLVQAPPVKYRMTNIPDYETLSLLGFCSIKNNVVSEDLCYLKILSTDGNKITLGDTLGNLFTYEKKHIVGYVLKPPMKPDNEKPHTVLIHQMSSNPENDMKCFGCNGTTREFLVYQSDDSIYCTATCGILCSVNFDRTMQNIGCVECGGNSGLFKQLWMTLQGCDDAKITIKYMYCYGSDECMHNTTEKMVKHSGCVVKYECDNCVKLFDNKMLKLCSRCRIGKYCSKDCQVNHWQTHKLSCIPCFK